LYLRVLTFYEAFTGGARHTEVLSEANRLQRLLRQYSVYHIALSRWPIFYALENFAPTHQEYEEFFCDNVTNGVLDWKELRQDSRLWANMKRQIVDDTGLDELEYVMKDKFLEILKKPHLQAQSENECEFGFYFVIANQVVAAASRETHHLPPFASIIDSVVWSTPFMQLAGCGWPLFAVLVIFSDLNKGIWFFGGDRKYLRGYSDWNLRSDELSPLVPSYKEFLTPEWRTEAGLGAELLAGLSGHDFMREVNARVARREAIDGVPLRPIVRDLVDAGLNIAAATLEAAAGSRRLAFVVLLYGEKWSVILARMVRRMTQLEITQPLLVVAIGEHASATCRKLSVTSVKPRVVCWTPGSQSQVHRFTVINAMLHLGIDMLYMDMDTYLVRDPAPRVLQQAQPKNGPQLEALFARHADADCINIGVFYLKATARTAVWMSQFLAWYHDHPFEIDQRGLHVFLQIPAKQLSIAYKPEDLVDINSGVLDDVNEIVIGDVGWHGSLPNMLIKHWCHRPIEQKEEELNAAYDAGDALEPYGLPLSVAISVAKAAPAGSPWDKVLRFREILEAYQKDEPPARDMCW